MSSCNDTDRSCSDHAASAESFSDKSMGWSRDRPQLVNRAWPPSKTPAYHVVKPNRWDKAAQAYFSASSLPPRIEAPQADLLADSPLPDIWRRVTDARFSASKCLSRLHDARKRVLRARRARDHADNKFMSAVRSLNMRLPSVKPSDISFAPLEDLFYQMQKARDEYQPQELFLEDLETSLQDAQDQLDLLERQLINSLLSLNSAVPLRGHAVDMNTSWGQAVASSPHDESLLGLEISSDKICHPLYQQLLATINRYHATRHARIVNMKRKAELEEKSRRLDLIRQYKPSALQHMMPLGEDDIRFLTQFGAENDKISDDLNNLSDQAQTLIQLCWKQDILPRSTPLEEIQRWYLPIAHDSPDLPPTLSTNGYTTPTLGFSILFSDPLFQAERYQAIIEDGPGQAQTIAHHHHLNEATLGEPHTDDSAIRARHKLQFIEKWLLDTLQSSLHEVDVLYSTFISNGAVNFVNVEDWQQKVLRNWFSDEQVSRQFEEIERHPASSITKSSSPPSWLTDPLSAYTTSSAVGPTPSSEIELGSATERYEAPGYYQEPDYGPPTAQQWIVAESTHAMAV